MYAFASWTLTFCLLLMTFLTFTPVQSSFELQCEFRVPAMNNTDASWSRLSVLGFTTLDEFMSCVASTPSFSVTTLACPRNSDIAPADLTVLQRWAGFVTFVNLVWTASVFLIVVGALMTLRHHIMPWFASIPLFVWEWMSWLASISCVAQGMVWRAQPSGLYVSLLGCLGLLVCTMLSHQMLQVRFRLSSTGIAFLLGNVWAYVAVVHQSALIGTLAVAMWETWLGFVMISTPLCIGLGFKNDTALLRAMGGSLVLLAMYVDRHTSQSSLLSLPQMQYFETGTLLIGGSVYFIGLLIVSSRFYIYRGSFLSYLWRNMWAFASCALAAYLGSVYPGLSYLQKVGGSFAALLLLNKYAELSWYRLSTALFTLILGCVLYALALLSSRHAEYFMLHL